MFIIKTKNKLFNECILGLNFQNGYAETEDKSIANSFKTLSNLGYEVSEEVEEKPKKKSPAKKKAGDE